MQHLIPIPFAEKICDMLDEHAQAGFEESWKKNDFIRYVSQETRIEYRFMGSLGFGGKFYTEWDRWRITCYQEDETPERLAAVKKINALLYDLHKTFQQEYPIRTFQIPDRGSLEKFLRDILLVFKHGARPFSRSISTMELVLPLLAGGVDPDWRIFTFLEDAGGGRGFINPIEGAYAQIELRTLLPSLETIFQPFEVRGVEATA